MLFQDPWGNVRFYDEDGRLRQVIGAGETFIYDYTEEGLLRGVTVCRAGIRTLAAATIIDHGSDLHKEKFLRRILTGYFAYYQRARTHLSLERDPPDGRPIEPPELGAIRQIHKAVRGPTQGTFS